MTDTGALYSQQLEKEIRRYERELGDQDEGVAYVILSGGRCIAASLFYAYPESNMLIVDGFDDQGSEVMALLPLLDAQVVLTKRAKPDPEQKRGPIGFKTGRRPATRRTAPIRPATTRARAALSGPRSP